MSFDTLANINITTEKARIAEQLKEATTNVSKNSQASAENMLKSAEDTAAASVQMATLAYKKLELAVKSLLSGKLIDPAAGQEN
jgi:hypothetical protein